MKVKLLAEVKMYKKVALLVALGLTGAAAHAQTTTPAYDLGATHRYVQSGQFWPQVQAEFALQNGDYVLLGVQGRRVFDDFAGDRSLGFNARQALVGYEHFVGNQPDARWSYGATARLFGTGGPAVFIPEVLVRHRAPIAGFVVGQRLGVERAFSSGSMQALESGPDGQFWARLRVDVERLYPLGSGNFALRPRLSYEAATHLRLQKADNDLRERTIQFTSLRAEVGVRIMPRLDVTPWFAYQTRYLDTLPQYDASGNPTAGGKVNAVYPTVGLDVRFAFPSAGAAAVVRQPLPTQH